MIDVHQQRKDEETLMKQKQAREVLNGVDTAQLFEIMIGVITLRLEEGICR